MFFLTQYGSLRGLARWLFLLTIVVAPWLYGGTTAWSIELINGLLGLVLLIWVASAMVDRRWPVVPRPLLLIGGLVLLLGWGMTLNAHTVFDGPFRVFVPVEAIAPRLPGSAEYVFSLATMVRVSMLLGAIFLVAEMVRRPHWLVRLWYSIAIAGASIALLGLIQKATGAKMIFWADAPPWEVKTFFAAFFYHANAGAFLNLVMPVAAGLALWMVRRQAKPLLLAVCVAAAFFILLAILSNTSRMAQLIGVLLVFTIAGAVARPALRMAARAEKRMLVVTMVMLLLVVVSVAQAVHLDQPLGRWQQFSKQLPIDERWAANRTALGAIKDGGVFGFGPGTFRAIFPHYQSASRSPHGIWRFLHNDYLQTIVEWGWLGALSLGALFFGGIGLAARNYFRAENWSTRQRILLACVLLALLGVAIHAVVDFPLQIFSLQLLVATYVGVCWGSGSWGNGGRKSEVGGRTNNR